MADMRANIKRLNDHLYLIDDAGESTCYLVLGDEKAMVIDTVNGQENLCDVIRTLTDKPLVVVNTHGHCDHIYGNMYFDEAWLHPDDLPIAQEHFGYFRQEMERQGRVPCPFRALEIGQVFDLGGRKLEVVTLKGHTPGSVGLLDRDDRLLYSGDGLNTHLWMQLDHSLPISTLQKTLLNVKEAYGQAFDRILTGHAQDFRGAEVLDLLLKACDELLSGRCEKDQPYRYFGGECLQHPISDVPGECIVYTEVK